jgi:CBS domain-containing membrane protein
LQPAIGALIGVTVTGLVSRAFLGSSSSLPFLIAPMGASAVILFALPASPLAQPWPVLGGSAIAALAGVASGKLIDDRVIAAGLAIGLALALMRLTRSVHPPAGAIALTAVVGGRAVTSAGWSFVVMPVALNVALMLAIAWAVNNLTGHRYPHRPAAAPATQHGTTDPPPIERVGPTTADVEDVLARYDELLDVSVGDLVAVLRGAESRAARRLQGVIRCEQIMSRDVIRATAADSIEDALATMQAHRLAAMPVLDEDGRVVGVVRHEHLLGGGAPAGDVMSADVLTPSPATPVDELLPALSGGVFHEAFVVDPDRGLLGMITQTDLLAALWRGHVAEQTPLPRARNRRR